MPPRNSNKTSNRGKKWNQRELEIMFTIVGEVKPAG